MYDQIDPQRACSSVCPLLAQSTPAHSQRNQMAIKPGSMVALVTPMKPDGAIDEQQLRDILRWHVECETDGVVVLGTTGEVRMGVCVCESRGRGMVLGSWGSFVVCSP